jgi:CheY-like chemotaxis protein
MAELRVCANPEKVQHSASKPQDWVSGTNGKVRPESQPTIMETALTNSEVLAPKSVAPLKHPIGSAADRRNRFRAKIVGKVHIRGSVGTLDAFEDLGKSIDVTRDGILLSTSRGGYWVGQFLDVTFPYWTAPTAINAARKAKVVRNLLLPDFRYAVALHFEQPGKDETAIHLASPFANQVRVLGVESDPAMAGALRNLLEHDGYHVVLVSTAQQALDILQNDTPDVILAEAEGGPVSGRELCTVVKKNLRLQHIPVILLTNSALPSDYSASHRAGAMVCIRKPCDPERLQRAVHLLAPPPGHRSVYSARFNMSAFVRTP